MLTNIEVAQDVTKLYHGDYYKSAIIDLDKWIIKNSHLEYGNKRNLC